MPFRFAADLLPRALFPLAVVACMATLSANVEQCKAVDGQTDANESAARAERGIFIAQLIRDPRVQADLELTPRQVEEIDAAYGKVEPRLWQLRDAAKGAPLEERTKLLSGFESGLDPKLQPSQKARLGQLSNSGTRLVGDHDARGR